MITESVAWRGQSGELVVSDRIDGAERERRAEREVVERELSEERG